MDSAYYVTLHDDLSKIFAQEWNALVSADNPFWEYEFLRNLELSGSLGKESGWKLITSPLAKPASLLPP